MLELASRLRAVPKSSWALGEFAARIPDDALRMILQEYRAHLLKRMAMRELDALHWKVCTNFASFVYGHPDFRDYPSREDLTNAIIHGSWEERAHHMIAFVHADDHEIWCICPSCFLTIRHPSYSCGCFGDWREPLELNNST